MPDGSSPDIKISKNPQTQARVEKRTQELSNLKRNEGQPPESLVPQARSQVATEIWIKKIRNMFGKKVQATEQRAEIAEANSMTDQLTGTKSRRWYDEQLETKMKAVKRHLDKADGSESDEGFYIAVYDLDKLKAWNTHYGSAGADEILKNVGKLKPRTGEDIARVGGDEFGQLINSNTTEEEILTLVRRNADRFHELGTETVPRLPLKSNRPLDEEPPTQSTFSVGLVRYRPGMTLEQIKQISDVAIAEAKIHRDSIAISRDGTTVEMVPRHIPAPQPTQI